MACTYLAPVQVRGLKRALTPLSIMHSFYTLKVKSYIVAIAAMVHTAVYERHWALWPPLTNAGQVFFPKERTETDWAEIQTSDSLIEEYEFSDLIALLYFS